MTEHRYVIADDESSLWGHLFGPGDHETMTRFVYDVVDRKIVAADYQSRNLWIAMDDDMLANFRDHLENANPDALDNPEDWDLATSDELPDWANQPTPSPV